MTYWNGLSTMTDMTLEEGSRMLRRMQWSADEGEDMMRLADAIDSALKAREAAQPVAYIATPCDPRGDPVLVFNAQGFHPEDFLVEPLVAALTPEERQP
jgi:hypothetical protein